MPTAQVSADMRKMRQAVAIAPGGTYLATTSVPGDSIEMWKAEIAALPVRRTVAVDLLLQGSLTEQDLDFGSLLEQLSALDLPAEDIASFEGLKRDLLNEVQRVVQAAVGPAAALIRERYASLQQEQKCCSSRSNSVCWDSDNLRPRC